MSHLRVWYFIGLSALACSSSNSTPNGGTAGSGSQEPMAGAAGSASNGGSKSNEAGAGASAGASSGGPSAGGSGDPSGGEESVGGESGAVGGAGGAPPSGELSLHCATPPFSATGRPAAYRLTLTSNNGSAAVLLTRGDAIERATSTRTTVVETTAPITADDARVELSLEGLSVDLTRGERPAGLFGGTLSVDGADQPISCWRSDYEPAIAYDAEVGKCQDSSGKPGKNQHPLEMVRETKLGQCVTFGTGDLNGNDLGYADLGGWQLAGADLSLAGIHFANLVDADLRGANLDGFSYGYANISGRVDVHTRVPVSGCQVKTTELGCHQ